MHSYCESIRKSYVVLLSPAQQDLCILKSKSKVNPYLVI